MFTPSGFKDIRILKFDFVAKTQLKLNNFPKPYSPQLHFMYYLSSFF